MATENLINQTIFNCFPRIEIFRTIYVFLKSFNGFADTLRENIERLMFGAPYLLALNL